MAQNLRSAGGAQLALAPAAASCVRSPDSCQGKKGCQFVQHESTATSLDLDGLACTSWDGDLRRYTPVDVLPLNGMRVLVILWDIALA